jgi:hypothetical protein
MATDVNGTTRPTQQLTVPRRIFAEEFLAYLAAQDEPDTGAEASAAGPRHLEPDPRGGWAVLCEGETLAAGAEPEATFLRQEVAQIAAAVLPGTAGRLRYRFGGDRCERGFPILFDGAVVGHARDFLEPLVEAMTVVDALLASPADFGWMLEALGGLAAERVNRLTAARLARP